MDKLKKIVDSRYFKVAFYGATLIIFAAVIFAAGIGVGLHKAKYSYQWGENYERNFAGGQERRQMGPGGMGKRDGSGEGMMGFFRGEGREMRNANGISGSIVSITENLIVIKDANNKENTVAVNEKTLIKAGRNDVKIGDLKNDEKIVVIGKPDDSGTIVAELIRVFDINTK